MTFGNPFDEGGVFLDQAAPCIEDGGYVLPVALLVLLLVGVFPLGEGFVKEVSSGVGGES